MVELQDKLIVFSVYFIQLWEWMVQFLSGVVCFVGWIDFIWLMWCVLKDGKEFYFVDWQEGNQ